MKRLMQQSVSKLVEYRAVWFMLILLILNVLFCVTFRFRVFMTINNVDVSFQTPMWAFYAYSVGVGAWAGSLLKEDRAEQLSNRVRKGN